MRRVQGGELSRLLWEDAAPPSGGFAFDGDGTLWKGDVSDDLFIDAVERGLLRSPASQALRSLGSLIGLSLVATTPSNLAGELFEAHRAGVLSEKLTYAMMTWCWAGWGFEELRNHARQVLSSRGLKERAHRVTTEILREASTRGHFVALVSASPQPVLLAALDLLGLHPNAVVASTAKSHLGMLEPQLEGEVPYGPSKAQAACSLAPGHNWLAAFGDSLFDRELLQLSRHAVVVGNNPELIKAMSPRLDVLQLEGPP
jgi:phosphatidylglycerophosphatase C